MEFIGLGTVVMFLLLGAWFIYKIDPVRLVVDTVKTLAKELMDVIKYIKGDSGFTPEVINILLVLAVLVLFIIVLFSGIIVHHLGIAVEFICKMISACGYKVEFHEAPMDVNSIFMYGCFGMLPMC